MTQSLKFLVIPSITVVDSDLWKAEWDSYPTDIPAVSTGSALASFNESNTKSDMSDWGIRVVTGSN